MTRINCVPVQCLSNSHLLAEYKEITRPFNKVLKRIEKHGVDNALNDVSISNKYVLSTGHESFFFNKLFWLFNRYFDLNKELRERDFKLDNENFSLIAWQFKTLLKETAYWNDWYPTQEDMYLNMARLVKRSNLQTVYKELENKYG